MPCPPPPSLNYTHHILITHYKFIYMNIQILQYRNGIYQGNTKANKRHGQGILITDDGQIFIGEWKNDQLCGNALIFISHSEYGFGEFNRGEIQGYFVFRKNQKTLFSEFNLSRPINKMLFIDKDAEKVQVLTHRSPIYEVVQDRSYDGEDQDFLVDKILNVNFSMPPLIDLLEKSICSQYQGFQTKILQNGNILFFYNDKTNPYSLGFVLNKNSQLVSYGIYMGDRLNGMGCKYENTIRYEGIFQNGFMNGIGLKCSQGKYSFGEFTNGNLTQAIHIEERSNVSEEKLKEFKKAEHIRSIWHCNAYVKKNFLKYKGIDELVFEVNTQQEYIYPQTSMTKSPTKKNQNIALKMVNKEEFDTKSSKSFLVRPMQKNPEEFDDSRSDANRSGINILNSLRKFKY